MELEATTAAAPVPAVLGGAEADEVFGSRPATGRPHSLSLHGSSVIAAHPDAARGVEVLIGVGIGAAIMYYFDPEAGARRRARVREALVQAATLAPDTFESAAQDVLALLTTRRRDTLGTAAALLGSTLLARAMAAAKERRERSISVSEQALEPRGSELRDPF